MDAIIKLRGLIWDKSAAVFTDDELVDYLSDCGNNVYRTAAHCLNIVRANPERMTQFGAGGVSMTYQDLDKAILMYQKMAGGKGGTISLRKDYRNETS